MSLGAARTAQVQKSMMIAGWPCVKEFSQSSQVLLQSDRKQQRLFETDYEVDEWTNLNESIKSKLNRNLLLTKYHPLNHLANKIKYFFYQNYTSRMGSPIFSIYDSFKPIVSTEQNFDSLLTPKNHVSRSKKDCFYVNKDYLLRSHTTAHDNELIKSGLDAFLTFGDVYRRDEIDAKHYPVFHQCDGVRLFDKFQLFEENNGPNAGANGGQDIFSNEQKLTYSPEAIKKVEQNLKDTLTSLAQFIFGSSSELKTKWTESTFPFTHPSWELEIEYKGNWFEVLGCGILRQEILENAGAKDHIAWAFGLGLERWAMILYDIPDIRIFWSQDSGFISQFKFDDPTHNKVVKYKPVSVYPQCQNDISFWLPHNVGKEAFGSNDFYDLVRDIGGDLIEQVTLIDEFENKKTKRTSHCYRIVYRSMERTLKQSEVNELHKKIQDKAVETLGVVIR